MHKPAQLAPLNMPSCHTAQTFWLLVAGQHDHLFQQIIATFHINLHCLFCHTKKQRLYYFHLFKLEAVLAAPADLKSNVKGSLCSVL